MASPSEEKRRFLRVDYKVPVRFQPRGTHDYSTSLTENISEGGIRITNYEYVSPNTYLNLEMGVLSRFFSAIGRVAWTQEIPHTNQYRVGIQFHGLEYNTRLYLSDFVQLHTGTL